MKTIGFVISDVHMGLSHDGLNEVIKAHKKKNPLFARAVKQGSLILFVNKSRTKAKLFEQDGSVIGYVRAPGGRKLKASTIDFIPETFGGSVEYSRAVKVAFSKLFEVEAYKTKFDSVTRVHSG